MGVVPKEFQDMCFQWGRVQEITKEEEGGGSQQDRDEKMYRNMRDKVLSVANQHLRAATPTPMEVDSHFLQVEDNGCGEVDCYLCES